ncbi:hypothetical protein DMENIID0001_148970 [Sergentomyia squamirostris]
MYNCTVDRGSGDGNSVSPPTQTHTMKNSVKKEGWLNFEGASIFYFIFCSSASLRAHVHGSIPGFRFKFRLMQSGKGMFEMRVTRSPGIGGARVNAHKMLSFRVSRASTVTRARARKCKCTVCTRIIPHS